MIDCQTLRQYLDDLLPAVNDYCPNGWQLEGRADIRIVVTGVTACQALIERAIELNADAVLVHHGLFWKHDDPCVIGMKAKRIRALLQHNINVFAYHLPLDIHPQYGNNVQLAQRLSFQLVGQFDCVGVKQLGCWGHLASPMNLESLVQHCSSVLQRRVLSVPGGADTIRSIAWCTGAAQDGIEQAACLPVDAYLTGEASERTVHQARELGIHLLVAGHHATERYGVEALGQHLANQLNIQHHFIDIDNPI